MFPEVTKSSEDLRKGFVEKNAYTISGAAPNYSTRPGVWTKYYSTNRILGTKCQSEFNRTKNYRPGEGSLNPARQYANIGSCPSGTAILHRRLGYKVLPVLVVRGEIATLSAHGSLTNFAGLISPASDDIRHVVNAVSKSREAKALLGVTLAEIPETIDMMRSPLLKLASKGKKLIPRKGMHYASAIANAWLTFRYGILPLMSEVDTYRSLIGQKLDQDFGPVLKARAGVNSILTISKTDYIRDSGGFYVHGTETMKSSHRISALNLYRQRLSGAGALGVSLASLPISLWELVPYSFVIDWFWDVGKWIQVLSPNNSVRDIGNCLSSKVEETLDWQLRFASLQSTVTSTYPASPCDNLLSLKKVTYQRNVNLALPELPQVNRSILGVARSLDSITLAYQRAKNSFPQMWKR